LPARAQLADPREMLRFYTHAPTNGVMQHDDVQRERLEAMLCGIVEEISPKRYLQVLKDSKMLETPSTTEDGSDHSDSDSDDDGKAK
jgi:hypothetical protein